MRTRITLTSLTLALAAVVAFGPADAFAQRRGARPGGGGGQAVARAPAQRPPAGRPAGPSARPGYRSGPAYRPYARPYTRPYTRPYYGRRSSIYLGFGWGSYPYYWAPYSYGYPWWQGGYYGYGYGYGYGSPYGYRGYGGSSMKVDVKPKDTEVYVDGHYAGVADDFDGFFQSLAVEPGGHDISLYRDGFKRVTQNIYFTPGETFRLRMQMVPLQSGESPDPRPVTTPDEIMRRPPGRGQPFPPDQESPEPMPPSGGAMPPPESLPPTIEAEGYGQLAIRVQPADARVFIDGEGWQGPVGVERLVVNLPAGMHTVEIRKDGFNPFKTEVEVKPGEIMPLNVSLNDREGR